MTKIIVKPVYLFSFSRSICVILFIFLKLLDVGATNYYVDSQLGSDTNNGLSVTAPWKTLAKVSGVTFQPSDSIFFKAGSVWNERVQFKGSGASGNPIVVTTYGGSSKPILNGGGGGVNDEPTVLLQNEEYWEIRNLEITNTDGTLDTYQGDLWGILVDTDEAGVKNHIYISDCYIHAIGSDVPEESKGGKDAGGISVIVSTGLSNPAWYDDLQITNNVIGGEKGGDLVGGVGISTQSPQGKLSHGSDRNPFLNVRIAGNVVGPTGRNNIIIRVSDGAVVEHNTLKESSRFSTGHNVFNFNCINTTIQFNEAYGNTGKESDVDRGGYDADFEIRDTYFQYNYSHDNNWGFAWMKRGENDNAVFRYNISQDDRMHIYHYGFAGETGPQNAQAYNNTHYVSAHLDVQVFSHRVANNTEFRNNIFYFEGQGEWGVTEPNASCLFDHNAFFNITPRGTNYITSDPKLVDMGGGEVDIDWSNYPNILTGYKLQGNSPCINQGISISNNGDKDFWGNSLYNGSPDIGAHEYYASGSSPSGAPSGLGATPISSTQINLSWNDNSNNESEFIIERKAPGESFSTLATVSANQTSYNDTDLLAAETYTYRLSAHNSGGNSSYSNEASATTDQGNSRFKIQADQDTYIRGGDSADDNYGDLTELVVKKGNQANFFRKTLIKFELGDYSNITSAKLRIYGAADESVSIRAYELSSDNWDESTLTWNTAPTFDASLGDVDMETTEGWYELDITAFASQEAGGSLSVGLDDPTASSETITLFSKEFELGQYSPYLLIEGELVISTPVNIVITEIMAEGKGLDDDTEYLEIYNAGQSSVNLDGYSISDALSITFTSNEAIGVGEYIVVARNAATYSENGYQVIQWSSGFLIDGGETITLTNASGATLDQVTYDNSFFPSTDDNDLGHSYSLAILDADNSDMTYWTSSSGAGTPGAANDVTVWTGNSSTSFSNAANWSNGLPSASMSAFVDDISTNSPVISSDIEVSTIKLLAATSLAINSGSLKVNNDFLNEGTITIASEASLLPMYSVRDNGSVTVNRNTTFSTTAGKYSVIGSPVESATTSDLGSIVYGYDETVAFGANGNDRFIEVTSAETMDPGDAYFSANTGAISFTGAPNSGTVSQTLVYDEVADGGAANAGFNLVSNPYTAAINVDLLVAENPDMSASIYLWQDESSNTTQGSNDDYVVYNSTDNLSTRTTAGGRTFDGYLRSTQGFFVKATSASTLNFTASMMSTGNNDDTGYFREDKEVTNYLRLSLNKDAAYSDMIITLRENATLGVDRLYDAYSLSGAAMKLYSYIGEDRFAFQGLPLTGEEITVDLGFDIQEDGIYDLNLEESLFDEYHVLLVDTELNKTISLTDDKTYTFNTAQVRDSKRFQLVLRIARVLGSDDEIKKANFNVFTDVANLNVRTLEAYDMVNIQVLALNGSTVLEARGVDLNSKSWTVPFDLNGLFIISIATKDGLLVKKFFK